MRPLLVVGRGAAAIGGALLSFASSLLVGGILIQWAQSRFPPDIGNPSTDPHGRGTMGAAAVLPLGISIILLLAAIGAWLGWLISDRKNWSFDLLLGAPLFLLFSGVCLANYVSQDVVFTRDAQAALNIPLAISGAVVVMIMQRSLTGSRSLLINLLGSAILAFCIYGFVAIPLWYSISYMSWKEGSGELGSLDTAAKAVSAASSILAVLGLQWKNGALGHYAGAGVSRAGQSPLVIEDEAKE